MKTAKTAIYLDYAAATPLLDQVFRAMEPYLRDNFYNPSSIYLKSIEVKQAIKEARQQVAKTLNARAKEIIFTAGGSESNNLAIKGLMDKHKNKNLIVSAIEHDSVLKPASRYDHKVCPVNKLGVVDLSKLKRLIDDQTVLISIMYVNNEIGSIQPIKKISELIKDVKKDRIKRGNKTPLYFHSDACQAANYLSLSVSKLGLDMMSLNGCKIYGPKQSGILFINSNLTINPLIEGGGQEFSLRSGTENTSAIVGFAKSLQIVQKDRKEESQRLTKLRDLLIDQMLNYSDRVKLNGSLKNRLSNNVNFLIDGIDNETLIMKLDNLGVMIASGSACNASNDAPSHVLKAIGLSDQQIKNSIRITLGRFTNEKDLIAIVKYLKENI